MKKIAITILDYIWYLAILIVCLIFPPLGILIILLFIINTINSVGNEVGKQNRIRDDHNRMIDEQRKEGKD